MSLAFATRRGFARCLSSVRKQTFNRHLEESSWSCWRRQQTTVMRTLSSSSSSSSSSEQVLVKVDLEDETGLGILTMNRPPANTLSLEMLQALSNAIKKAESNHKIQALILASSSPKIFSAGLELSELYQPDTDRLRDFWNAFQQLYLDLYGSRLSTLAAIGGFAPAAGCMLALSCDYRIFSSTGGKIGLNESLLGIVAPPWLGQQYIDTIGHRKAELALSLGTLYSPEEALEIGLVDEVAVHDGDVVDVAKQRAREWIRIPRQARSGAKDLTRGRQIQYLIDNREADIDHFCSFVTQDKVQKSLGMYIEQLSKKKK